MLCKKCGIHPASNRLGYSPQNGYMLLDRVCWPCYYEMREVCTLLNAHRSRSNKTGEPCTLTSPEWIATLKYFNSMCAYCLKKKAQCLEHFVPLGMGLGTVKENCVPACHECNRKKAGLHPSIVTSIPAEDIERVRHYLMSI